MSAGQFSEKPLPPQKKECPRCGEMMPADAARCWLCLETLRVPVGGQIETTTPKRKPVRPRTGAWGDRTVFMFLGVLAIFLCIVFAIEIPGMLIFFAILFAPALIRTIYQTSRTTSAGVLQTPDKVTNFLTMLVSSFGVVALVVYVAIHAFWAAFIVVCIPAMMLTQGGDSISLFMLVTIGAGLIAAMAVIVKMFHYFWSMPE